MLTAGNYTLSVKGMQLTRHMEPQRQGTENKDTPSLVAHLVAYTIYSGIVLCILLSIIRNLRLRQSRNKSCRPIEVGK
mgnify:CR=1 FL=1